jgi:hypothetical protein
MKTTGVDMQTVLDAIVAINSEKDYTDLLNVILLKMRTLTNCDAGTLYVLDGDKLIFSIMHNDTLGVAQKGAEITLPPVLVREDNIANVSAYAAVKKEIVHIEDAYANTRFNFTGPRRYDEITGYRTRSLLSC